MNINFELKDIWEPVVYMIVCLVLLVFARAVYQILDPKAKVNDQLVEKDNVAYAISHVGYFIGILLTIWAVMNSEGSDDIWKDVGLTLIYGIGSIFALLVTSFLFDKAVFRKVHLMKSANHEGNIAASIILAGVFISVGMLVSGAIYVEATQLDMGLALTVLGIALVLIVLSVLLYEGITSFKVQEELSKGNMAVAMGQFGAMLALGILLSISFSRASGGWADSFKHIVIDTVVGVILIIGLRTVADKLLLPGRKLSDELTQEKPNVGAGLVEGFAYVFGALVFISCWALLFE